jgi:hypothetical protein
VEENFACCEEIVKATKRSLSRQTSVLNPLKAELNPICQSMALLGAHHILHVSRVGVNIWKSSLGPVASPPALLDIGIDGRNSRENVSC